jgi:hypothetical protein
MEWSHQDQYTTVVPLPLIELPANINLSPAQAIHHGGIIAFGMFGYYLFPCPLRQTVRRKSMSSKELRFPKVPSALMCG